MHNAANGRWKNGAFHVLRVLAGLVARARVASDCLRERLAKRREHFYVKPAATPARAPTPQFSRLFLPRAIIRVSRRRAWRIRRSLVFNFFPSPPSTEAYFERRLKSMVRSTRD